MKLFKGVAGASISMCSSGKLRRALRELILQQRISCVVESGTYDGLGSTTTIAECFDDHATPRSFFTLEANWSFYRKARRNLRRFPFVTPIWGRSISLEEAVRFIDADEALSHHDLYPEIFIDELHRPKAFYKREIQGGLGARPLLTRILACTVGRLSGDHYSGENLLEKYVLQVRDAEPLIALDSSGGIGLLEFDTVTTAMGDRPFALLLDDIHHLKHFRSFEKILANPNFQRIDDDFTEGWSLSVYNPSQVEKNPRISR